ncbi:hypothetical protein K2F54_05300 [Cryobacterium sp. 1639]|uniref:hypothetical protein n=1 Tax=Cryobacterium inferilacus TaxID=2866629 RepID=UPI001C73CE42|nr:hypothetical protein [Cryobacterium sp. 1639]MBX0299392.1 hypothetical protein [Cryobacterium sp. 1639]
MPFPTAEDVAAFLGKAGDLTVVGLAGAHLPMVTELARAHTRGKGFTDYDLEAPVASVIVSATARLTNNPELLVSETIGDYSARYTVFQGWSIIERSVLDGYRRRTA